ncbi:MAG: hypothetical protein HC875_39885 [Anaerolineales bacterium]|nr:hypothetical protein [Anaerolineales bacterium]
MLSRFSNSALSPKQILTLILGLLLLAAGLSLASYRLAEKELTARRGPLALIPRSARQTFVIYRGPIGAGAAGLFILTAAGWMGAEGLARTWQKRRNEELAANAVLLRLAPRVDDKSQWTAAADLWAALHSTLARPGWQSWLGAGLHLSFEIVQQAGERLTFYLWAPRPVPRPWSGSSGRPTPGWRSKPWSKAGRRAGRATKWTITWWRSNSRRTIPRPNSRRYSGSGPIWAWRGSPGGRCEPTLAATLYPRCCPAWKGCRRQPGGGAALRAALGNKWLAAGRAGFCRPAARRPAGSGPAPAPIGQPGARPAQTNRGEGPDARL